MKPLHRQEVFLSLKFTQNKTVFSKWLHVCLMPRSTAIYAEQPLMETSNIWTHSIFHQGLSVTSVNSRAQMFCQPSPLDTPLTARNMFLVAELSNDLNSIQFFRFYFCLQFRVTWSSLLHNNLRPFLYLSNLCCNVKATSWRELLIKWKEFHKGCYLTCWFVYLSSFTEKNKKNKKEPPPAALFASFLQENEHTGRIAFWTTYICKTLLNSLLIVSFVNCPFFSLFFSSSEYLCSLPK